MDAKVIADAMALDTDKVHSVRIAKNGKSFYVTEGMVGSEYWSKYTARPETLRWKQERGLA